jgi:hypothetical protein
MTAGVYAVGNNGTALCKGCDPTSPASWEYVRGGGCGSASLHAVTGGPDPQFQGSTVVWAMGDNGFFCQVSGMGTPLSGNSKASGVLTGVWMDDSGTAYAVSDIGELASWTSTAATTTTQTVHMSGHLTGISGDSSTSLWVTDRNGYIYHGPLMGWSTVQVTAPISMFGIWVKDQDPSSVWAVGAKGTIYRPSLGGPVSPEATPSTASDLHGVWATSDLMNIWAVGDNGTIMRQQNAPPFTLVSSGTSKALAAISGYDSSHIWIVGANGTILSFHGP